MVGTCLGKLRMTMFAEEKEETTHEGQGCGKPGESDSPRILRLGNATLLVLIASHPPDDPTIKARSGLDRRHALNRATVNLTDPRHRGPVLVATVALSKMPFHLDAFAIRQR
jgi:hypothetical protein